MTSREVLIDRFSSFPYPGFSRIRLDESDPDEEQDGETEDMEEEDEECDD